MTQARGNSTRRQAYSEEYTSTVQPVNKRYLHSTTTIQLHLTIADHQRIHQDLASEFFLNKTTRIYARRPGQHHSLINTKLGNPVFISTTPGGSEPKTKDQEYKKLNTTTTTIHQDSSSDFISKEKSSEKARSCGIDPKARGSGATLSECTFTQKEPGHKLGGCMPPNYSDDGLIQD